MTSRHWLLACTLISLCLHPARAFSDISYNFSTWWPAKKPLNLSFPTGVAVSPLGDIFVTDRNGDRLAQYTASVDQFDVFPQYAELRFPSAVAVGPTAVYVADSLNHRIQMLDTYGYPLSTWGSEGSAAGQFSYPAGVALDSAGNVYVADHWNNRIQKFTSTGTFIRQWGSAGTGNGQFGSPYGVAVDGSDNVYVADSENHRVQKFTSDGAFLGAWGGAGTGDGQFNYPAGVSVDGSGNVYVADAGNDRIQKFSASGSFLLKWGSHGGEDGFLNGPIGINAAPDGYIYVADSGNGRIQKFSTGGVFQQSWNNRGGGNGYFKVPYAAAVDAGGNLLVTDGFSSRIQKFDADGNYLTQFGSIGNGDGQLLGPVGIALDAAQNVYVANSLNNRIEKFTPAGAFAAKFGTRGTGDGQFSTPKGVAVDAANNIYVVDTGNNRIQKIGPDGSFLKKWGGPGTGDGQFDTPTGIAIDNLGSVYVSDTRNNRVQKFLADGTFVTKWGVSGSGQGQFKNPTGLAIDPGNNVFVVDSENHRVQQFTSDGTYLTFFGTQGSNVNEYSGGYFEHPNGIALNPAGTALYVVDTGNRWIQKFNLTGIRLISPNGGERWPAGTTQKITWQYLGDPSIVIINVLKGEQPVAVPFLAFQPLQPGAGFYSWSIPANQALGSDYQVVLQGGTSVSVSAATFSVTGPQYLLTVRGATGAGGGTITGGFAVRCNVTAGGIASGACSENQDRQSTVTLTVTPGAGGTVTWSGCTSVNGDTCSVTMTSDKTVSASFSAPAYTITTAAGAHGGISCTPITSGGSTCTITPDTGYYVSDTTVGPTGGAAASVGAVSQYNFTSIASNMTIAASFLPYPVKRTGSAVDYFSTLSGAYATATTLDVIMGQALTVTENLTCNRNVEVKFSGGHDTAFATHNGATAVKGSLKISNGKVVAERILCHQ